MHDCTDHLRALARQSRLLARRAADRQREVLLHDLAQLYESQAADLERRHLDELSRV